MARSTTRSAEVLVEGGCELRCALCDCRDRPTPPGEIARLLRLGGARLVVRGGTHDLDRLGPMLRGAAGFGEVVVRTHGLAWQRPAEAARLAAQGVHTALVPLFSQHPTAHDRIAGLPDALARTLAGLRSLAAAGLALEIEIPLLSARLQDLEALVTLAHRAVPSLRAAHFYVPRRPVPPPLAPPPWGEAAPRLARALELCQRLGIATPLPGRNAVPLCALREFPEGQRAYRFDPRVHAPPVDGCGYAEACAGCAARSHCPGLALSYREAHGVAGIAPYSRRPRALYEQRTSPGRVWTEAQRAAARRPRWLVLRLTVNCNQDCTFCSVNETAKNAWSDPDVIHRAIARAARRGSIRVNFTGGEPTLSPQLPAYIATARRCGIPEVDLCTNGVLLDTAPKVDRLVRAGLTHAFVSLHAHDEALSRLTTLKENEFERTVRSVGHLLDAGVVVTVNHVMNARNYRYLSRFVEFMHARFGGRALVTFSFITPQYKALDNFQLVPRISEVIPHLKRAAWRALALGQPFYVGARQGVPPCFLGEFRAWSDVADIHVEAVAEDGPEKRRGPQCERCRYSPYCTGLWVPYADRFGLDELVPLEGAAFSAQELRATPGTTLTVDSFPRSFDGVPAHLRDLALEAQGPPAADPPPGRDATVHLPVLPAGRTRPLRLALFGSGRRALHLALGVRATRGLSLDAVVSPHALDADLREFGDCPRYRDAGEAAEAMLPDGVLVASATRAHASLARLALARRIPALIEQPVTERDEDVLALAGGSAAPAGRRAHARARALLRAGPRRLRRPRRDARRAAGALRVPRRRVLARHPRQLGPRRYLRPALPGAGARLARDRGRGRARGGGALPGGRPPRAHPARAGLPRPPRRGAGRPPGG
jgi:molybdenum cofactor biosynthesis enzyme MoaA